MAGTLAKQSCCCLFSWSHCQLTLGLTSVGPSLQRCCPQTLSTVQRVCSCRAVSSRGTVVAMSLRGRGCLEVRHSDNPFFQPVSADLGRTSKDIPEWKIEGGQAVTTLSQYKSDGNFSFLYTRESDRIGSRVKKPENKEVRMLSRTEFLKQRREKLLAEMSSDELERTAAENKVEERFKASAEDVLAIYKHEPKYEDPRYITSTSEYGKKAPSVATIVVDRAIRPQGFSKSFNNIKPKNTSLTTALTKSNVHKNLDPQFA